MHLCSGGRSFVVVDAHHDVMSSPWPGAQKGWMNLLGGPALEVVSAKPPLGDSALGETGPVEFFFDVTTSGRRVLPRQLGPARAP